MSPKKVANKSTKSSAARGETSSVWSDEEKAAMKAIAQERKAEARANKNREEGENAVLEAIAAMPEPDRSLGTRLHAIITANAPALLPKTWYGMPAYANQAGNVICFFQPASKFKARYGTLGFNDRANLDEGAMWPVAFAVKELTPADEKRIAALVKRAVS